MAGPGWLIVARVKTECIHPQIKNGLWLSKWFGTHSTMYGKPLESFKQGHLYQGSWFWAIETDSGWLKQKKECITMILHSLGNSGEGWRSGSRLSFQEWRSKPCWRTGLMRKLPWLGLPLPPHPALEETAVTAVTTGEWLPPSNATHFCRVLHQQNARFQKKKKKTRFLTLLTSK